MVMGTFLRLCVFVSHHVQAACSSDCSPCLVRKSGGDTLHLQSTPIPYPEPWCDLKPSHLWNGYFSKPIEKVCNSLPPSYQLRTYDSIFHLHPQTHAAHPTCLSWLDLSRYLERTIIIKIPRVFLTKV